MVHFVGAGPGAEDLMTVRGQRLLMEADVVIYTGSLINPKVLEVCRSSCRLHNSAYMTLHEVITVIEAAYGEKKKIVRLHTGDPSLYGAIREQMDILRKQDIPYEICPGVSSFCGAASALRVEYTLPDVSQSVIITRMEGRTKVPPKETIESFAAHQATMVIFLSTGMLEELQSRLIKGGYREDTRAAIVYKATWPEEKICRCLLGELAATAKREKITKTALIVVGEILGDEYTFSKLYDRAFTTEYRKELEDDY